MLSFLYLVVKAQRYFVTSSCMSLDEKTVLEIWLNPGLHLQSLEEPGPEMYGKSKASDWGNLNIGTALKIC